MCLCLQMPFFWKSGKNERIKTSPERMKAAVLKVVEDGVSVRAAAKEHSIDRKTLGRYVDKFRNGSGEDIAMKPNYVTAQIFTDIEENL